MLSSPLYQFPAQAYLQLKAPLPHLQEHREQAQWLAPPCRTHPTEIDDRQLYQHDIDIQPFLGTTQPEDPTPLKGRINMAMVLLNQNEELLSKIKEVALQLEEEKLKGNIFAEKVNRNNGLIEQLRNRQQEREKQERMNTLNESLIPTKSHQMSTTYNTSSWINEFLDKDCLQSLWNSKNLKESSKPNTVKYATIDLSGPRSTRDQKQVHQPKSHKRTQMKDDPLPLNQREQLRLKIQKGRIKEKKTIVSMAQNAKQSSVRGESKAKVVEKPRRYGQMYEKKTLAQKPLSYARQSKKLKSNAEA